MSRDRVWVALQHWRGLVLAAVALVVTLWLALTNQLILYINPRYIVFTVIMAALALVLVVASFARRPHSHDEPPTRMQKVLTVAAGVLTLAIASLMIVVPPATLSSATAIQRDINSPTVGGQNQTAPASSASAAAYARFTVLDWSSLLRQTTDASFYQGKTANVIGFVTPDTDDPSNVFFVSRFVITCCAVDAQPIGVPVYLPDWKQKYSPDSWVRVAGGFTADPSRKSSQQIALIPTRVAIVSKPSQPYLF
jgi:uncharacterized repeat protein (TIGR03943 family)